MKQLRFRAFLLALTFSVGAISPAVAHQPVFLDSSTNKVERSPVLVDGTVSFAVTADFAKAAEIKHFRFALKQDEPLKLEYLILDRKPENSLSNAKLPQVTLKSPSGKSITLRINERTKFYEPFGRKNYLFLSRMSRAGEPGIYTVTIRARAKSSLIVAVGSSEVRGEVMNIATGAGNCPQKISNEIEVTQKRAEQLVGLSERAGELCAALNGWDFRTVQRDGEDFAVTMDYRSNRVNVKVAEDRIFEVTVG